MYICNECCVVSFLAQDPHCTDTGCHTSKYLCRSRTSVHVSVALLFWECSPSVVLPEPVGSVKECKHSCSSEGKGYPQLA